METAARSQCRPLQHGPACGGAGAAPPRVPQPRRCRQRQPGAATSHPVLRRTPGPPTFAAQNQHRSRRTLAAAAAAESSEAAAAAAEDPSTAFDWRLGLALAGCAFEAYNEIEVEADTPSCLKMTSMGGTQITFVDK